MRDCFGKNNDKPKKKNSKKKEHDVELNNVNNRSSIHDNKGFQKEEETAVTSNKSQDLSATNKIDDETFKRILLECDDLTEKQIEKLLKLPDQMKFNLILSKQKTSSVIHEPVSELIESIKQFTGIETENPDCLKFFDDLKLALRIRPISFISIFLDNNGFEALLEFLDKMTISVRKSNLHFVVMCCIKSLMNNTIGRQYVVTHENGINIIVQSLHKSNTKVKTLILELLGAVCFLDNTPGHEKVFSAIKYYKKYSNERLRFQSLIRMLDDDDFDENLNLKIAIMSFINAILCRGTCGEKIEFRLHVRYEFLMLGIQAIIDKLRKYQNNILDKHLDFFEAIRYEDESIYSSNFDETHINTKSANFMLDLLCKRLVYSTSYVNLLSILHHLLIASINGKIENTNFWCMIDCIIQQIVTQLSDCKNINYDSIKIDINEILIKSNKENELKNLNEQINSQQTEISDLKTSLSKQEKELNSLNEENDCLKASFSKLKQNNEEEIVKNKELQIKLKSLEADYKKLQHQFESKNKITSLSSVNLDIKQDIKLLDQKKNEIRDENQGAKKLKENSEQVTSKSLPPPPSAPLPPPLPTFGESPSPKTTKKIPKSKVPMKCFNWNKLPLNSFDKTLWKNVNDENIFTILNLDEFQKTFSAYQKPNETDSLTSTIVTPNSQYSLNHTFRSLENITKIKTTRKEFSVIDFTRGRNCTILLSKLKITTNELKNILLNFDDEDELPRDMIEQLLKFIPTVEEETLLEDNLSELPNMAKADRFLFEVSKIYRYKQKLETILFKKKYLERYKEIRQLIDKIINCCEILKKSKNVIQLLEIVLAMGNFMNQSHKKGVAVGFSISNLNKLIDIKSANDRSFSLFHFLVITIQDKFPTLVNLPDELTHISDVSKINFENLQIECSSLETGFDELENEIEIHLQNKTAQEESKKFTDLANDFLETHSVEVQDLNKKYLEMKIECSSMLKYFGEEEGKSKLEEFFLIWHGFLQSFNDIKIEIKQKKQREIDEKKHKEESLTSNKINKTRQQAINVQKNEIDDSNSDLDKLISIIRSGNAFNNNRKRRKPIQNTGGYHSTEDLNLSRELMN